MVETAIIGVMLGGAWLVYGGCRWVLAHLVWSFATNDSDRIALSFLAAMTYLLFLAMIIWSQRQR